MPERNTMFPLKNSGAKPFLPMDLTVKESTHEAWHPLLKSVYTEVKKFKYLVSSWKIQTPSYQFT